jgi:hypothetical protein
LNQGPPTQEGGGAAGDDEEKEEGAGDFANMKYEKLPFFELAKTVNDETVGLRKRVASEAALVRLHTKM